MGTQTQIDRIVAAKTDIKAAIEGKGVTVPSTTKIDGMAALIESISGGKPEQTKTVTPKAAAQTVTPDSGYTLSAVTVQGDADLVASNIKSGVDIFGVTGTYEGSGGGGNEDAIITRTVTEYESDSVETIGNYAFAYCSSLTTVNFPACTSIGTYAFSYCENLTSVNFPVCTSIDTYAFHTCYSLTSVNFPACTSIGINAFGYCQKLTSVSFPACTRIGNYAFSNCSSLTTVNFPACTSIGTYAFYNCKRLTTVSLGASTVCTLSNSNAFSYTSMRTKGYIYVPSSLLTSYKTATNWTYFSSRIFAMET